MTTDELGKALSQARTARGLTIHDVERDTRISGKYIRALEEGHLEELPAPVYARAFLRTYAQYLGLNANALVQRMPGARPEPELPPLPEVGKETTTRPLLSASWLIAAGVIVAVLGIGLVLFWTQGDEGGESLTSAPPAEETEDVSGQGAENTAPTEAAPALPEVTAGVVPDLENHNLLVAVTALHEADLSYVVVEVENDDLPEGTVFQQSPTAGSPAETDTVVTLLASR